MDVTLLGTQIKTTVEKERRRLSKAPYTPDKDPPQKLFPAGRRCSTRKGRSFHGFVRKVGACLLAELSGERAESVSTQSGIRVAEECTQLCRTLESRGGDILVACPQPNRIRSIAAIARIIATTLCPLLQPPNAAGARVACRAIRSDAHPPKLT